MANNNTKQKRKAKVGGYGAKRGKPVHTTRFKKKPWLYEQAKKKGEAK